MDFMTAHKLYCESEALRAENERLRAALDNEINIIIDSQDDTEIIDAEFDGLEQWLPPRLGQPYLEDVDRFRRICGFRGGGRMLDPYVDPYVDPSGAQFRRYLTSKEPW